jgi:hypothetical protein
VPKPSARHAAADDAAYWYDLLAEDPAPQHEEARGPFEPLRTSRQTSSATSGGTSGPGQPDNDQPQPGRHAHLEAPEQTRARKLEQLKDLYLTAEAIGEQNVDKHFDQLLAQQRELISEYFRQSGAAQAGGTGPRDGQAGGTGPRDGQAAETEPLPRQAGGQAAPPEGASVRAEPPRAW